MKNENYLNANQNAFKAGRDYSKSIQSKKRGLAFYGYRTACGDNVIAPSISASVCFVAGYLGKTFPSHDNRVTS